MNTVSLDTWHLYQFIDDYLERNVLPLFERKQQEYVLTKDETSFGDAFHNFDRASELLGGDRIQALAGFMCKHTVSLYDLIQMRDYSNSDLWDEKILDHIVYLLILRGMIEYHPRTNVHDENKGE